jgi:glutamate-1-semialdehyde 2,1-aminomutase
MRAGVRRVADRAGVDVQVTGVQHLVGVHYTDAPVRTHADVLGADQELLGEIGLSLLSQGVLMYGAAASASAAMAERDVDGFLAALGVAFEETGAAKRCRSRRSRRAGGGERAVAARRPRA